MMTTTAQSVPIRTHTTSFSVHSVRTTRILLSVFVCIFLMYISMMVYINSIGSEIKHTEQAIRVNEHMITEKQSNIFTLSNNSDYIRSQTSHMALIEPTDSDIHYMSVPDTAFVMR